MENSLKAIGVATLVGGLAIGIKNRHHLSREATIAAGGVGVAAVLYAWIQWRASRRISPTTPVLSQSSLTALIAALKEDDTNAISLLVRSEQVHDVVDEEGKTLFLLAACHGGANSLNYLLQIGADEFSRDFEGWPAMHLALKHENDIAFSWFWKRASSPSGQAHLFAKHTHGWSLVHLASLLGNVKILSLLLPFSSDDRTPHIDLNGEDAVGHTALFLAVSNQHRKVVEMLLEASASPSLSIKSGAKRKLPIWVACRNGDADMVNLLLKHASSSSIATMMQEKDSQGSTVLHAAVASGNQKLVEQLLSQGAALNEQQMDGSTAAHIAAFHGNKHPELLRKLVTTPGVNLELRTVFGTTPLHVALINNQIGTARTLIESGANVQARDNDGQSPLHALLHAVIGSEDVNEDLLREAVQLLLKNNILIDDRDASGATALHITSFSVNPIVLSIILEHKPNPFIENSSGWTPLHCVVNHQDKFQAEKAAMLRAYIGALNTPEAEEFFRNFDLKKAKVDGPKKKFFLLSETERFNVLEGEVTLDGIASRLASGKYKKIIVLTGAGISTNAKIPDFRTPGSGVFANTVSGQSAFNTAFFASNPKPFFDSVRKLMSLMSDVQRPTLAHRFIALLAAKGLLLRNYTQNIDALEKVAGVPNELLVQAHGTLDRAACTQCSQQFEEKEWKLLMSSCQDVPQCPKCGGVVKPAVVLYGDPLPSSFMESRVVDMRQCDLLIVMGTTLAVYPFAGLVNEVPATCPRLLINRESVGAFRTIRPCDWNPNVDIPPATGSTDSDNYRDVACLGDIDQILQRFLELLEWPLPE